MPTAFVLFFPISTLPDAAASDLSILNIVHVKSHLADRNPNATHPTQYFSISTFHPRVLCILPSMLGEFWRLAMTQIN